MYGIGGFYVCIRCNKYLLGGISHYIRRNVCIYSVYYKYLFGL